MNKILPKIVEDLQDFQAEEQKKSRRNVPKQPNNQQNTTTTTTATSTTTTSQTLSSTTPTGSFDGPSPILSPKPSPLLSPSINPSAIPIELDPSNPSSPVKLYPPKTTRRNKQTDIKSLKENPAVAVGYVVKEDSISPSSSPSHHPSHALLDKNGFTPELYQKYRARCLKGNYLTNKLLIFM